MTHGVLQQGSWQSTSVVTWASRCRGSGWQEQGLLTGLTGRRARIGVERLQGRHSFKQEFAPAAFVE